MCRRAGKPPFCRFSCAIVNGLFVDLKFRHNFRQNFSWTTVKTLVMDLVSFTAKISHFEVQMCTGSGKPPFCRFSSVIVHGLFGDLEFRQNFAKFFLGRPLKPYLWNQLALTAKTSHFKSQMCPRAGKPPILPIFVCYSPWTFW